MQQNRANHLFASWSISVGKYLLLDQHCQSKKDIHPFSVFDDLHCQRDLAVKRRGFLRLRENFLIKLLKYANKIAGFGRKLPGICFCFESKLTHKYPSVTITERSL
jgi:hypothetical protein